MFQISLKTLQRLQLQCIAFFLLVVTLFSGTDMANAATKAVQSSPRFPAIWVSSLQGQREVFIPNGLEKDKTFVAVGFDPKQQALLEQGLQQFQAIQKGKPSWGLMEIAVIDSKYKPFRVSIESFMRRAVKTHSLMPYVYSLYSNGKQLRLKLGLAEGQDAAFLLVDRQGHILWRNSQLPGNGFLSDFPYRSP